MKYIYLTPSKVNGTELGVHGWRNSLLLHYGIDPPNLPDHCSGYVSELLIFHALACKKVSLITVRHNKLRDGVSEFAGQEFTPTHVRDDPKRFTGRAVRRGKSKSKGEGAPSKDKGDMKGYLLIQYLWKQGTYIIHDMSVVNTDAISYQSKPPEKYLETAEW